MYFGGDRQTQHRTCTYTRVLIRFASCRTVQPGVRWGDDRYGHNLVCWQGEKRHAHPFFFIFTFYRSHQLLFFGKRFPQLLSAHNMVYLIHCLLTVSCCPWTEKGWPVRSQSQWGPTSATWSLRWSETSLVSTNGKTYTWTSRWSTYMCVSVCGSCTLALFMDAWGLSFYVCAVRVLVEDVPIAKITIFCLKKKLRNEDILHRFGSRILLYKYCEQSYTTLVVIFYQRCCYCLVRIHPLLKGESFEHLIGDGWVMKIWSILSSWNGLQSFTLSLVVYLIIIISGGLRVATVPSAANGSIFGWKMTLNFPS